MVIGKIMLTLSSKRDNDEAPGDLVHKTFGGENPYPPMDGLESFKDCPLPFQQILSSNRSLKHLKRLFFGKSGKHGRPLRSSFG